MTGFHPQNDTPHVREIPRQQSYIWLSSVNKLDFQRFSDILLVATREERALLARSPDEASIVHRASGTLTLISTAHWTLSEK